MGIAVSVGAGVGVFDGSSVNVGVSVGTSVAVALAVCVAVWVDVALGASVGVAVAVGVFVGVKVKVTITVGVRVAVGVDVGVRVSVGDGVTVAVGVRLGVLVAVKVGVGVRLVPLSSGNTLRSSTQFTRSRRSQPNRTRSPSLVSRSKRINIHVRLPLRPTGSTTSPGNNTPNGRYVRPGPERTRAVAALTRT